MKTKVYNEKSYPVLSKETDNLFHDIILMAKDEIDYSQEDEGTCVVNAGVKIQAFRSPRHKYPESFVLVNTCYQGNIANQKALEPVLKFLNQYYPELNAYYSDETMN